MFNTFSKIFVISSLLLLSCSKEEPFPVREEPTDGSVLSPNVGGPNETNQVFVNLSNGESVTAIRDSWELRFYNGELYRVGINTSVYMAVKSLEFTDIDLVGLSDVESLFTVVATGTFEASNVEFVDDFDGNIENTAIDEISEIDTENKVYLVNMGYQVGSEEPPVGSVAVAGDHRGWKKIRILIRNEKYLLQYADIESNTHHEIEISKDSNLNFTHFSLLNNAIAEVEPIKKDWDICFTVFTNVIQDFGTYGYTDFVVSNNLQNTLGYMVYESEIPYVDFDINTIDENKLETSQRFIGASWRSGGGPYNTPAVYEDRYYIIKDNEEIYYKLRFISMYDATGKRGYPQFEYKLL